MALVAITHMETLYTRRSDEGVRIHFLSLAEHPSGKWLLTHFSGPNLWWS